LVDIGKGQTPAILPKYKHLMPEDTILWRRFISNGQYLPDECWYDIRVGQGITLPGKRPGWMDKFAEYSYRKRIDIVWRKGGDYWVVECKPGAGVVALGQVIYYGWAFEREYQPTRPIIRAIITDYLDQDLLDLMQIFGVVVFEVGVE